MQILIIGGTRYIGRYLVKFLMEKGHNLTLFHRGKTNKTLFPEIPRIFGDREIDIENIGDQSFDVVIDTCGYTPKQVQTSVDYLIDKVDRYIFISSIDAFEPTSKKGLVETDPTQDNDFSPNKCPWWKTQYGRNKAICEEIVQDTFAKDNSLIIRPGMVIGPYDPVLFFPYWVLRIEQGGDLLAPGYPYQPIQYIDVRDLTLFVANMVDKEASGIYTVTGPYPSDNLGSFLRVIQYVMNANADFTWVDSEFLIANDIETDRSIPYWLPGEEAKGYCNINTSKAINEGLTFRPLKESVKDVADWIEIHNKKNPKDKITLTSIAEKNRGLSLSKEMELLERYEKQD